MAKKLPVIIDGQAGGLPAMATRAEVEAALKRGDFLTKGERLAILERPDHWAVTFVVA